MNWAGAQTRPLYKSLSLPENAEIRLSINYHETHTARPSSP